MAAIYLHDHKEFPDLLRILEEETDILAGLIEKDYWIMHSLYGLKKEGYDFQLKGGTSLSKGFGLIDRFLKILIYILIRRQNLGLMKTPITVIPGIFKRRKIIMINWRRK